MHLKLILQIYSLYLSYPNFKTYFFCSGKNSYYSMTNKNLLKVGTPGGKNPIVKQKQKSKILKERRAI